VREVRNSKGYEAESKAINMKFQSKIMQQRKRTTFIHTNCEEVIDLPTDHNKVLFPHVCPTRHMLSPNELKKQTYKQIAKSLALNSNATV